MSGHQELVFPGYPRSPGAEGGLPPDPIPIQVITGQATGDQDSEGRLYASTRGRLQVGMSGGPVVNVRGKCVGMAQGVYQALPSGEGTEEPALQQRLDGQAGFLPTAAFLPFLLLLERGVTEDIANKTPS